VPTPFCGNHLVTPDEQCDDGNAVSGDGCDADCTFTQCGNGILTPFEECDDGNNVDGDGCSSTCVIEGARPSPGCGNHVIDAGEQCDDGSGNGNDGCCDAGCQLVDSDFDRLCDALDPCTGGVPVNRAKIVLARLEYQSLTAREFSKVTFKGETEPVIFPSPTPPDPPTNGVRILIDDDQGNSVLDVTIGGGLYDPILKRGWIATSSWFTGTANSWFFQDKSGTPRGGIFRVKLQRDPYTSQIRFLINGKNGFYDVATSPNPQPTPPPKTQPNLLHGVLVLDPMTADTGECAELEFPGGLSPTCVNRPKAIRCK
jgi:cysteine-rich repeat protein